MATTRVAPFPAGPRPRTWAAALPRLRLRWVLLVLLSGLVLAAMIQAAQISNLSREIAPLVESELWTFPSMIYSRPQWLHVGLRIDKPRLVDRLTRLGYTESPERPGQPGQFRSTPSGLEIHTRGFDSPAGKVDGAQVRLTFRKDGKIASVQEISGRPLDSVVIEPELLANLSGPNGEQRTVLRLSEFPKSLVQAVIAAEDRRFFQHPGIDPLRIVRAFWTNVRRGEIVQGASTITQQTAKNLFLQADRTWSRKFREAQLALALEARYPKETILEIYLNEVYLGQANGVAICGFGEAARYYLGKDARDLDLAESAMLAGMIPAPTRTNPFKYAEHAVDRRNTVLQSMLVQERISEPAYRAAIEQVPRLASGATRFTRAPFFVQLIRKQLRQRYTEPTITRSGMRIYTTLDTHLQAVAEEAVRKGLTELERRHPRLKRRNGRSLEATLVVLDPASGQVLALVGGRDFSQNQFDHATLARRQPGSLFKPLVYLAGFDRAEHDPTFPFTAATLLDDSPLEMLSGPEMWSPQNYDLQFRGPVTVRQALEQSLNVPAVRASQYIGLDRVANVAKDCGLEVAPALYPSLALGSGLVTPIDMARAYAVIANGGTLVEPVSLLHVMDRRGTVLERSSLRSRRVVSETSSYTTLDLMRGVLDRGTGRRARGSGIQGDFAGKTGTTDDKRDAWFIGFSPDLLAAVWVGFDDNSPTGLTGASGALPIWIDFMRSGGASPAHESFVEPPGIVHVQIDARTGAPASEYCPEVLDEVFQAGTEPLAPCADHQLLTTELWGVQQPLRNWELPTSLAAVSHPE